MPVAQSSLTVYGIFLLEYPTIISSNDCNYILEAVLNSKSIILSPNTDRLITYAAILTRLTRLKKSKGGSNITEMRAFVNAHFCKSEVQVSFIHGFHLIFWNKFEPSV